MKENIIATKTYAFSVSVIELSKRLMAKNEYVLSKQLLKSGTSIGANVEEAIGGISKRDFRAKMSISYKEARETHYWLRLLKDTDYINNDEFKDYEKELSGILKYFIKLLNHRKNNKLFITH